MGVSTGFIWILSLIPQLVTAQAYFSSQPYTALGPDGSTMYLPPDSSVVGNRYGGQIVGYELVPADGLYNQQTALTQGQPRIDRMRDIFFQQSISPQSIADYRRDNTRNLQNFVKSQTSEVYPRTNAGYRHIYGGRALVATSGNMAYNQKKSGYDKKKKVKVVKKPVYVPVPIKRQKKKKKKSKTLSVSKGFYIAGGSQMFGKFKSLKSCQEACDNTAHCFGGDYDKWTKRCYMHTNTTACNSLQPHKKLTNFRKVPCSSLDLGINYGRITLGTNLDHGLLQKGVKDIQTCIKKCLQAGGGVAPMLTSANTMADGVNIILETPQLCFGIDYDFANHKCYFHTSVTIYTAVDDDGNLVAANLVLQGIPGGIICLITSDDATPRQPQNLLADSSVVNIVICPEPSPVPP